MRNKSKFPGGFNLGIFSFFILACGTNIYTNLDKKETNEVKKEKAIVALNQNNFTESSKYLEEIWASDKSNEIASLYSISKLGESGIEVFCLIRQTLSLKSGKDPNEGANGCPAVDTSKQKTGAGDLSGNNLLETIATLIPASTSDEALAKVKSALDILDGASNTQVSSLKFQRCVTAGIYASPILAKLNTATASIQATLTALPARLGASGTNCSASASTISAVGSDVNGLVAQVGDLSKKATEVAIIIGQCIPASGSGEAVNAITAKTTKLLTEADKGCAIPAGGQLGTSILPSCMNPYLADTTPSVAGDGIVSGCEMLVNCASGSCLK